MSPQLRAIAAGAKELADVAPLYLRLSLLDFSVVVRSESRAPLTWLRWFTAPCFPNDAEKQGDWQISYRCNPQAFNDFTELIQQVPCQEIASLHPDGTLLRHREYQLPDMRLLYNDGFDAYCCAWPKQRKIMLLAQRDEESARLYLARATRKLMVLHYQRGGSAVFHASAYEQDGGATLGIAYKGGGKTTLLVRHLMSGAHFITNDRALIYLQNDRPMVSGLPNIVTLRPGTLELFPKLKDRLATRRYRQVKPNADRTQYRITSAQLCRLTEATSSPGAPVRRILFLSPEAPENRPASREEARTILREAIFDYGDRPRVFFSSLYPVDQAQFRQAADALCETLIDNCSCEFQGWWEEKTEGARDRQRLSSDNRALAPSLSGGGE